MGWSKRPKRTPLVLQLEAVECVAASLGVMLAHFGRYVPLSELREQCGVSRNGSNASNLLKAARLYGLKAKGFKKTASQLAGMGFPQIIFWDFNHFLVLEGIHEGKAYLNDPACGHRTVNWEEFEESYTGLVLVMEPGETFQRGGKRPSVIRALRERLEGSRRDVFYLMLTALLLVVPGLALPVATQIFVDYVLIQDKSRWLVPLILSTALVIVLQLVLTHLRVTHLRRLKSKLAIAQSSRFMQHLLSLPLSFYAQRYSGEIANRVQINDRVAGVLSGNLAGAAIDLLMILLYGGLMFLYDPVLAGIAVLAGAVNLVVLYGIGKRRVEANMRFAQANGRLSGLSLAGLSAIETLKASASEGDFFTRWAGYQARLLQASQEMEIQEKALAILPGLLSALTAAAILVVGGFRVADGHLSLGMLMAIQAMVFSFLAPIDSLVELGGSMQELVSDLNLLDDVLDHEALPLVAAADASAFSMVRLRGELSLDGVSFGHSRSDDPLITDFSLLLKPGARVALVGGSGSGKSTVARLVAGQYEPWTGEIRFDGRLRHELPRSVITGSLAMVDQELVIFAGSVRDNLTMWDPTIPDRQLFLACQDAAIMEVIQGLPRGFDTVLPENGSNLSGGQRQRLEIARALAQNPSLLILDEATSALDAKTERLIDMNLRRRGCTCLIVAHRLSTIRDCDEILVMESGRVVERGTHEQLWAANGTYARMVRAEQGAESEPAHA
ncbi:Toxin RTX-I translocation ATP-binding protein [compost metagenome]